MNLFDIIELDHDQRPVLMPMQDDLLERGYAAYVAGARRVIYQAPCGAGKTVVAGEQTRRALAKGKTVLHIVHRRRLVDQMLWTLDKFGIKAAPIMDGRETWTAPVRCASRDTLLAMLKAGAPLPRASLIVQDECHVAASEVMGWYLKNAPEAFWTGYTATPVRPDGGTLKNPWQALVCMGSARQLIEAGRLCPVKVFNPDAVGQRRRKGEKVKPVGDPITHWQKYAGGLATVVYAATVLESKGACQRFRNAGVTAEHIDASTPEDEREAIFERSRQGITCVICNCGVMIEGVDLPWLVCCQILRGCNSLVLWQQATGRVMRAFPGKPHGIVLDHAGAAHEFGMPDGDFHWTLEDGRANVKKNKPAKDQGPVTCNGCGAVFQGRPACPECGKPLPARKRRSLLDAISPDDGVLTQFTEGQRSQMRAEALARLFKKCVYVARARGGSMGMANAMFAREAKVPAWQADLPFKIPEGSEWRMPAKEWEL